jgi:hypothetical protein
MLLNFHCILICDETLKLAVMTDHTENLKWGVLFLFSLCLLHKMQRTHSQYLAFIIQEYMIINLLLLFH